MSLGPLHLLERGGAMAGVRDSTTNQHAIRKHVNQVCLLPPGFPNVSYTNSRLSAPVHNVGPLVLPEFFSSRYARSSFTLTYYIRLSMRPLSPFRLNTCLLFDMSVNMFWLYEFINGKLVFLLCILSTYANE